MFLTFEEINFVGKSFERERKWQGRLETEDRQRDQKVQWNIEEAREQGLQSHSAMVEKCQKAYNSNAEIQGQEARTLDAKYISLIVSINWTWSRFWATYLFGFDRLGMWKNSSAFCEISKKTKKL